MKTKLISSYLFYLELLLYPARNYGLEVVKLKNTTPVFVFKRENQF
ncbi:MAG: hypothetical protein KGM16_12270 [Bacteroidota bacterium]|nr:hypothetical protein [Bacteroidota bacterium]